LGADHRGADGGRGVSTHRTQTQRVIAAARSYRGVTQADFLLPDVCDGGPPITRLAARLWDAEQEGYSFECVGRRDKCKAWRLIGEPDVERATDEPAICPGKGDQACASRPVGSSLDIGVGRTIDEGPGGVFLPPHRPGANPVDGSPSAESPRLFEVEPERTHHYEEAV
jgi:hypothetical protein